MKRLIKKFVLYNLESLKLSKTRFYCFYPLQSSVSNEKGVKRVSRIFYTRNRTLNSLKFPLKFKDFDDSRKLFLSLKRFKVIFVRYNNFFSLSNTGVFDKYFSILYNFNLFSRSIILILYVHLCLRNFERGFISVLALKKC